MGWGTFAVQPVHARLCLMLSATELQLIVLFGGGIASVMSLVFVHMWRTEQPNLAGVGWWAIGAPCMLAASVFFSNSNNLPEIVIILCGNLLLHVGTVAFYVGTEKFYRNISPRWPFIFTAMLAAGLFVFGQIWPDYRVRVMLIGVAIFAVEFMQVRILWPRRMDNLGVKLVLAGTLFRMLVICYRFIAAPSGSVEGGPLTSTFLQVIGVGATPVWLLAQTIGFMLIGEARLRERIQILANTDSLTGIMNRNAILRAAESQYQSHVSNDRPLSVLLVDLDHFKTINDRFGHLAGDDVLRDFVRKVRSVLRDGDLFGRYGGEEFLLILPETDAQKAIELSERMRALPSDPGLPDCKFSIGLAELKGRGGARNYKSLDAIINSADRSLYKAKSAGRDRLVFAGVANI